MDIQASTAVRFYDLHPTIADLKSEVFAGLARENRQLPPKLFYDRRGSRLFDAITELPEYYPTRTEISILQAHGAAIAASVGQNCLLLELGSGSSQKIRVLLEVLKPAAYMPLDISREHLLASVRSLAADFPALDVYAACTDYSVDFTLPVIPVDLPRVAFFPGSSIGNFEPGDACELLQRLARHLGEAGKLLIGVDLKKNPQILYAAYNDSQDVTAEFNLNMLRRINRELDADFNLENFSHDAFYDEEKGRIEMHLVSEESQTVTIAGRRFEFSRGESIHTENSYKYSIDEFLELAAAAGFVSDRVWTDDEQLFSVHCLSCAIS